MIAYILVSAVIITAVLIFAANAQRLAENYRNNTSGSSQTLGEPPAARPAPLNAPAPHMTAGQNAHHNTHGSAAHNAARNSGQSM